jgi:hypothetical protein
MNAIRRSPMLAAFAAMGGGTPREQPLSATHIQRPAAIRGDGYPLQNGVSCL